MKFTLEMEVPAEGLEGMFAFLDWQYAANGVYGVPNAAQIKAQITRLAHRVKDEDLLYARGGRFVVIKADEAEGVYDVLLDVGMLWDEELTEDERDYFENEEN